MTWTYDGLPGTTSDAGRRDAVRLHLRDTSSGRQLFSDEEVAFFLGISGNNVFKASARGCDIMSAREAQAKSIGDLSISGMGINWRDLAKQYRRDAASVALPYAGGLSIAEKQTASQDTDLVQPNFRSTMMDPT